MGTIITIVGAVDGAMQEKALARVKAVGVDGIAVDVLHPGRAIDLRLQQRSTDLTAALRHALQDLGAFDIFVQPDAPSRKKKLLIADMDATMVRQETLDELAAHFNLKDQVAAITEKAMRGEVDFHEALRQRVRLLKGLPVSALHETLREIEYSPGAKTLVQAMRRQGATCVLVSGGFDIFTGAVAATLGFHKDFSNRLEIVGDRLTGEVIPPIVDKFTKEKQVVEQAAARGCPLDDVVAVGDGANDIPMLLKAGAGVGYFAKPAVVAATPHQIRHTDLTAILYMQGYRHAEL